MKYILLSVLSFVLSVLFHLLVCRLPGIRLMQIKSIFLVTWVGLTAEGLLVWRLLQVPADPQIFWHAPLVASALTLYLLLMLSYFVFFANAVIESPTERILNLLARQGGATLPQLRSEITDQIFIISRIEGLEEFSFVRRDGERFQLTSGGEGIARFLAVYQKILGRGMGG